MAEDIRYYEFEDFELDVLKRLLLRRGELVPLPPKALDLLLHLLRHVERVVTKSELMSLLWPHTAVEESNLTQTIFMLRKALGEAPHEHRYIVTVPGRGYRFVADARGYVHPDAHIGRPDGLARHDGTRRINSIAVLPFRPLHAQPGDEYLGLGLADTLTVMLGSTREMSVRPTSAVFKYADPACEPLSAGHELAVDALVHGTFQHIEGRLRIVVQLVDVRDGRLLWAEKLDQSTADIFALEDALSERVGRAVMVALGLGEQIPAAERYTENREAYEVYLKGRYFANKRTPEGFRKATECFEQASLIDPAYALAYAGLADCHCLSACYSLTRPVHVWPRAEAAATRALEISDKLAEAHASLVLVRMGHDHDWAAADRECQEALRLNPAYPTAYDYYAEYLMAMGRLEQAIGALRKARELDPLSLVFNRDLGVSLYYGRRYEGAIQQLRNTLELDPEFALAHWSLGSALERAGRYEEALSCLRKAVALSAGPTAPLAEIGFAHGSAGRKTQARKILGELTAAARQRYVPPYEMAIIHAAIEEKDQAFHWLEKAYHDRVWHLVYFKVDPRIDNLRSDPRFAKLSERLHLED